jgi:hypothetical protein
LLCLFLKAPAIPRLIRLLVPSTFRITWHHAPPHDS